jgi:hypothetical protein
VSDVELWNLVEDNVPLVPTCKVRKLVKALLADKQNLAVFVGGCQVLGDSYP